jgi:hypothetical protein
MSRRRSARIIDEMAANAPDRAAVLEDIQALTTAQEPLLEQVERTLADGYACAMAIEAERLRLRRQLEEQAALLGGDGFGSERVSEVSGLAQGIARTDGELTELRSALGELAATARKLRAG